MANIRIKDQTTDTALAAGDYVIVDNETEGTRKFDLGQKLENIDDDFTDVRQDLGDLTELETEDKSSLVNAINEANQHGSGGITVVNTVAEMTDTDSVYLYNGTEVGYTAGHWYYYDTGTSSWTDGGNYTGWATIESAIAQNTVEMGVLSFNFGGDVYTYNGTTNTQIIIPNADSISY